MKISPIFQVLTLCVWFFCNYSYASLNEQEVQSLDLYIESGYKILEKYSNLAKSQKVSIIEAQESAKNEILNLSPPENGNFAIFNEKSIVILLPPKRSLEGRSFASLSDPKGKRFVPALVKDAQNSNDTVYTTYYWPEPGAQHNVEKALAGKYFRDWGWVISVVIYTADAERGVLNKPISTLIALIELYKKNTGSYPKNLYDLGTYGVWTMGYLNNFQYEVAGSGYNLFYYSKTLPNGPKIINNSVLKGTGIKKHNL